MADLNSAEKFFSSLPGETVIRTDDAPGMLKRLCRGKTVVFSGTHAAERFRAAGFTVWCGVEAEPVIATVERMAAFLARERPDTVAAVGGGSVMDAAKAALLMHETGWKLADLFGVNRWSSANSGRTIRRLIAIPGTSGTGSEATPYSNIVSPEAGVKKLICEAAAVPEYAVIAPELTYSMPPDLTRATGCDALAHLIEGFLNVGADSNHPGVNDWAKCGIALVAAHLPAAMRGEPFARKAMAYAALLGGMTIRFKSTGLPHLCSFSWYGRIAHGDAVAVLLPACWRYYLGNPQVAERTLELADVFPGDTPEAVIASYEAFLDRVGMPGGLSAWSGIDAELIERTAKSGAENPMKLELAPRPVPLAESYDILKAILKLSL